MAEKPQLDLAAIERHADEIYRTYIRELTSSGGIYDDGSVPFDKIFFFLRNRIPPGMHSMSPEECAGLLIAITGCIQEYLENEHGVAFKPM